MTAIFRPGPAARGTAPRSAGAVAVEHDRGSALAGRRDPTPAAGARAAPALPITAA
jgi:hypothetical protein